MACVQYNCLADKSSGPRQNSKTKWSALTWLLCPSRVETERVTVASFTSYRLVTNRSHRPHSWSEVHFELFHHVLSIILFVVGLELDMHLRIILTGFLYLGFFVCFVLFFKQNLSWSLGWSWWTHWWAEDNLELLIFSASISRILGLQAYHPHLINLEDLTLSHGSNVVEAPVYHSVHKQQANPVERPQNIIWEEPGWVSNSANSGDLTEASRDLKGWGNFLTFWFSWIKRCLLNIWVWRFKPIQFIFVLCSWTLD